MAEVPFQYIPAPTGVTVTTTVSRPSFPARFHSSESINCNEPIIFHYTSAAGALGILTSGQLWSTLVYHMNDSQECKHAHSVAMQSANILLRGEAEDFQKKFMAELRSQLERISQIYIFAACFSEASDLLSQWRGYATSNGYSLGFSLEALRSIAANQNLIVSEVLYQNDQQRAILQPLIKRLLDRYDHSLDPNKNRREIDELFWPTVQAIAQESVRIKDQAFSEEREWRIYSQPFGDSHSKMDFTIRNDEIVPILKVSLENGTKDIRGKPLRDICARTSMTGPGANQKERSRALQSVVQRQSIYWHMHNHSRTPLR